MPAPRDTDQGRRKRRKRPSSTPVSRARAQERQYVSQGRSVERTGSRQRAAAAPRKQGPRQFEPFTRDHGLDRETRRALGRTRRAEKKLPDNPAVPHIPVIAKGYTPKQRRAIRRIYRSAAKRSGAGSVTELYQSASPNQRRQIRQVGRLVQFGPQLAKDLRPLYARNRLDTVTAKRGAEGLTRSFKELTSGPHASTFSLGQIGDIGKSLLGVGQATYESPGQVTTTSLRTARESITGLPQGIKALATHPVAALEAMAKDYEDRYGSIDENPKAFRERVKTEWGLTPYIFDAATAATGAGMAGNVAAKSSAFARASRAMARAEHAPPGIRALGRFGVAAHRAATEERPALRFSGGEEKGVRPQARSRNLFKNLGQDVLDRRRARWAQEEKAKPGEKRALNLSPREGEVTPITSGIRGRSLRETKLLRRYTGRIHRDMGGGVSVQRIRMLTVSGRVGSEMRKRLSKLNAHEEIVVREMAELGVKADAKGIAALRARLEKLEADFPDSTDAVAIRQILDNPGRHLTQRVRDTVDEIRDIQLEHAAQDPRLVPEQELIRRLTPQADLLGESRQADVAYFRGVLADIEAKTEVRGLAHYADRLAKAHPSERAQIAKQLLKDVHKQRKAAERDLVTAERRLAVARERERTPTPVTTDEVREARRELARATQERDRLKGELKGRRGEHETVRGVKYGGDYRIKALRERIAEADQRVKDLRQRVRQVEAEAPRATAAQAARVERRQIRVAARRSTRDHVQAFEKAMVKVYQASRSKQHMRLESGEAFAERVRKAADEAGLAEPAYWQGVLEGELDAGRAGAKAVGRGVRATGKPKATGYKLTRSGRGERDPEVLVKGVESNIKRRFQYQLVARNIETHAFEWSRQGGKGMTVDQLKWYMRRHDIDPDSVELLDTRIITRREENTPETDLADDPAASFQNELRRYRIPGADITRSDFKDLAQNRYLVFPREVGETLDGVANKMDSTGFRAMEVLLKQKPARIMLGAANIPWLGFQVASNALLTGLGGGLNPFDIYGAAKWWRGLDPEARDAMEAELGITHGHHFGMDQPNLGETNSRMVAGWRGFKQTKAMRVGHRMNPLDAMFKADEAQNNFFRRTLFYSQAKRAAYRRMGSSVRGTARGMDKLMSSVMSKDPERLGQAIAQHGPEFEQVAKHVKTWLGDYVSFSPAERFLLSRNVMFYGYLRFSLRFVFHTMPIGHPVMTTILSDIGRMGAQEIKELFGVPRGYSLPASMLAQAYSGDRRDARRGTLRSVNYGRMNPFLNAVTQMENPSQAFGLVSPIYQALADQAFEESSFTGRDWRVRGEPLPSEAERPSNYYTGTDRARIFAASLLGLAYPYRAASDILMEPSQSDDALLFSPRPLRYKDEGAAAGVAATRRDFRNEPLGKKLLRNVIPVVSKRTAAPQVVARELEKRADYANRRRGRRKRKRSAAGSFGGSSGGGQFGGGGGSQFGG